MEAFYSTINTGVHHGLSVRQQLQSKGMSSELPTFLEPIAFQLRLGDLFLQ